MSCKTVISTDIILEGAKALDSVSVSCPQCYESFQHVPLYTNGNPRNIAPIGHWMAGKLSQHQLSTVVVCMHCIMTLLMTLTIDILLIGIGNGRISRKSGALRVTS